MAGTQRARRATDTFGSIKGQRRRALLLSGAAGLAVAFFAAAPAKAACSPDPTLANGTTVCTGTDSDGVAIPTATTTVRVAPGAIVGGAGATSRPIGSTGADTRLLIEGTVDGRSMAPAGAAIQFSGARPQVDVLATGTVVGGEAAVRYVPATAAGNTLTVDNAGRIEASGAAIQLQSSPIAALNLTNRAGGVVRGDVAIAAIPPAAFGGNLANIALLDNAGTISGTGGRAIDLTGFFVSQRGSIGTLLNRAGGRIEGELVVRELGQFVNAGVMDGGTRPVFENSIQSFSAWTNSGTITSRRADGTTFGVTSFNLTNSGTISNTGGGTAISTTGFGTLINNASGLISTTGATALQLGSNTTFDNSGRVIGDVNFNAGSDRLLQRGIVQGSVRLGGGDDVFLVDVGTVPNGTGVSGTIDAGTGIDAFGYTTSAVHSVTLGALPTSFERYILDASGADAVLTVSGTAAGGLVTTQGTGTVISALNITATGENALQTGASTTINRGTIDFTGSSTQTTQRRSALGGGRVINEGTIIARGAQTVVSSSNVAPENRGTIRLLEGAALTSTGAILNLGTIELASASSQLFSREFGGGQGNLDNRGTIASVGSAYVADTSNTTVTVANSGTIRAGARALDFSARTSTFNGVSVENKTGGTLEGVGTAILGSIGGDSITNAGRIVGDVILGGGNDSFLSAGRLEGNLSLGDGNDVYLIDVGVPGVVTGTIDAGAGTDTRRLYARSNAVVDYAVDSRFEVTDLLVNGATSNTGTRPVVVNRTALTAAPSAAAVGVSGNVAFTNAAALTAAGAGASAIQTGLLGSGIPSTTNEGAISIDGGAAGLRIASGIVVNRAAITGTGIGATITSSRLDNMGRIATSGAAVQVGSGTSRINNSGALETSTGAAVVNLGGGFTFRNLEGGVVRGGAGAAYQGSGSSEVVYNAGRFVGDVSLGNGADTYQYAGGTIEGRLLLGSGNDRVDVGLRGLDVTLATGGVDAGDGTDIFGFSVDTTRSLDLVGVAGFEGIAVTTVGSSTEVTLNAARAGVAAFDQLFEAAGEGTIVNNRAMARTDGTAVQTAGSARFINRATIDVTANTSSSSAVGISGAAAVGTEPGIANEGIVRASGASAIGLLSAFLFGVDAGKVVLVNSGTVSAAGGATGIAATVGTVRNSGTVTADAPSLALAITSRLINEGTVTASGVGAELRSDGSRLTNSGTISAGGPAVAAVAAGRIVNSGRLQSTSGAAIQLTSSSTFGSPITILNEATGAITGIGEAIAANPASTAYILNRGTITGGINFASGTSSSAGSGDVYFADGGRVIGDVRFGASSDLYVAALAQASNPGASISGVLDMGEGVDTLRLRTDTSAAATALASAAGFERLSYEAAGRTTTLTLTSPTALSRLDLAGDGIVDLGADFQTAGNALTLSASTASLFAESSVTPVPAGPRVISRGTITSAAATGSSQPVVSLGSGARFENAGAIRLTQITETPVARVAVAGSGTVVNSGRIELSDLNTGVSGATLVVNSGTIAQSSGLGATGVSNVRTLENSGTIRTGDLGVFAMQTRVLNSGTIESSGNSAIGAGPALVVNAASGRITARTGSAAITSNVFSGSDTLVNAGIIDGKVELGGGNDLFIAAGGRIEGSVSLGAGDDTFLIRGSAPAATLGVTNDGGRDAFGRSFDASASYSLEKPVDYDLYAVEASGVDTTVTLTSAAAVDGGLRAFGSGTIDNRAAIALTGDFAAATSALSAIELRRIGDVLDSSTLRFINAAPITSTGIGVRNSGDDYVAAGFARFENRGTIDTRYEAVQLVAETRPGAIVVANSGTLKSAEGASALSLNVTLRADDQRAATLPAVELANSGTVSNRTTAAFSSGARVDAANTAVHVANSGTIEAAGELGSALQLSASQTTFANNGRLLATGRGSTALDLDLSQTDIAGNSVAPTVTSTITNDGLIQSNADAAYAGFTVSIGELIAASTAVTLTSSGAVELRNNAAGTIEATGDRAGAILVGSTGTTPSAFTLVNAGTIRGTGLTLADREGFSGGTGLGTGRALAGALHTVDSIDAVTNAAAGRIFGGINLGTGNDSLENFGRIEGNVLLGAGNDRMVQALAGALVGTADGGDGIDALVFDISGGGTIDFRQFSNFENISQRGRGAVTFAGLDAGAPLPIETFELSDTSFTLAAGQTFTTRGASTLTGSAVSESVVNAGTIGGSVNLGGGNDTLVNSGTIGGSVIMGDGDDSVTNMGQVGASVMLGAGADRYITNGLATVAGSVDGGDGVDTLEFSVAGTPAAPTVWNGGGTTGFEVLQLTQGTLSLTGTTPAFGTFNVNGGYFVGQAGSLLTAATINVATGAIFGSSGRVVGNVNVTGTLSPGSSPGTMTVTGNVAFAAGSTALFELTPTLSDLLLVSGTTSIGANTTLRLTGTRAGSATPLDLIVSDGGITGSFASIDKDAAIIGFVAQRGNRLQLIGQFGTDPAFSTPALAAISYVNAALVAGQVSPALATALPSLLNAQGASAADRFGELTPEAYATASSYGAARGLLLADTLRTAARGNGDGEGPYGFAAGTSEWVDADGGPASSAEFETRGLVGGVGYRFESGSSVAAFVGTLDGEARTAALRARTDVDGVSFGVHGHLVAGSIDVDATLAYDAGRGKLSRTVSADASTLTSRFDLNTLVADLAASTRIGVGAGWTLIPRVGVTHVGVDRNDAGEAGSPFALSTEGSQNNRLFGAAALELQGSLGSVRPFASLGVRHLIDGREAVAAGQFGGITGTPLRATGAYLGDSVFSLGGGASVDVSSRVRLTGSYEAKVGDRESHAVTVGLNAAF